MLPVSSDGLTGELLRSLHTEQYQELVALAVSAEVQRPLSWKIIPVAVLRKPGAITLANNRLIAQQAVSRKLYLSALREIIYSNIEQNLDFHMGGIRKGDLASAWVARTHTILCKTQEWGIPAIISFIDISRAFATVDHAFLLQACISVGVDLQWIRLLHCEMSDTSIEMRHHGRSCGHIQISRGLIEGLPLSSLLLAIFLTFFWRLIRATEIFSECCLRLPQGYGQSLVPIVPAGWVDDWILAAPSIECMQLLLHFVIARLEDLGMQLAQSKIQWMAAGVKHFPNQLFVQGTAIRRSDEVTYLGCCISHGGGLQHIDFRFRKMMGAWGASQRTLRKHGASNATFCKAADAIALPSLVWGLESHVLTTNMLMKVQQCYNSVLRSIFGRKRMYEAANWILTHSEIRSYFIQGKLTSPAVFLYKNQDRLIRFLNNRPHFDLNEILEWRGVKWLHLQTRATRPARSAVGTPPKYLDVEFSNRDKYSVNFRAYRFAQTHCVHPFS